MMQSGPTSSQDAVGAASLRVRRVLSITSEFTAPKTKKSRRRIDLGPASVATLKAHRKDQLEERMMKAGL